ncbi:MAG: 4-hydroxy-tetrahydrodipicolinate reductase [Proteobacteria bacterium]|nr:4-hydroxy-tetrahydrodipicolinate reductase [Cystobacterineae bacterium]MCL2259398.1 4-hydroxy-tetrahydrodipicolinate reductase [Cystobacterineae bacterium]MCL2314138.1 4-hydroxy-tetrahydrodipicolinate reductase [Pseudomonadota bacterium]
MTRVAIVGALGRMGQAIIQRIAKETGIQLAGAVVEEGSLWAGKPLGEAMVHPQGGGLCLVDDLGKLLASTPVDVVIDFTAPAATVAHAALCAKAGVALVAGTTGLGEGEHRALEAAALRVPVLWAPNMSIGIQALSLAIQEMARRLGAGWEVEVLEIHHKRKKDAPSGTALKLAEDAAKALGLSAKHLRKERSGMIGERPAEEIGIQSLRGGEVVGEHTIYFFGEGERIELRHSAQSREQFAQGALRAARWLHEKPAGLYSMGDVLS